jgi:PAS domain S-box-containing protein
VQRFIAAVATLSNPSTMLRHSGFVEPASVIAAVLLSILEADFTCIVVPWTDYRPGLRVFKVDDPNLYPPGILEAALGDASSYPWYSEYEIHVDAASARTLRVTSCPLGIERGAFVAAGSSRAHFPSQMDRLLIGLSATQMALCLQRSTADELGRRFTAVTEHVRDLVGVTGLDGVVQYLNRSGRTVVGLEEEVVFHKSITDLVLPTERERVREEILPVALERGRWVGTLSMQNFRTGMAVPLHADWFRIDELRSGRPVNLATVSRDLSEAKCIELELNRVDQTAAQTSERASQDVEPGRTEMRLRRLQRCFSQATRLNIAGLMISTISHKLNQPLTAAVNSLNTAIRLIAGNSGVSSVVREVLEEGAEQSLLAGQTLNRMRSVLGRRHGAVGAISLMTVMEDAAAIALNGFETSKLSLKIKLDPGTVHVAVDHLQLQQVMVHLLCNALEAITDSPVREILVRTRRIAEMVEVSVADTGPGVPVEIREQMFEPFYSTKKSAIGLGLPLCRSIVESYGGRIWIEPSADQGVIFRFTIPAAKPGNHQDEEIPDNLSGR